MPPPAAIAMRSEFDDRPFGVAGEFTAPQRSGDQPAPEPPQPLVIEPPPWAGQEAGREVMRPPAESQNGFETPAYVAMGEPYDPPRPGQPAPFEPLRQVPIPEVDWQAEAEERARREAGELQRKLEPPQSKYPAKKTKSRLWRTS